MLLRALAALTLTFGISAAFAQTNWPNQTEGDYVIKDFHFADGEILPEDMGPTSLVGGGLIAGGSLYVLYVGIASLVASGAIAKIFGG